MLALLPCQFFFHFCFFQFCGPYQNHKIVTLILIISPFVFHQRNDIAKKNKKQSKQNKTKSLKKKTIRMLDVLNHLNSKFQKMSKQIYEFQVENQREIRNKGQKKRKMIPISYWMIVQLTLCFPCKRCCRCCAVTVHVGINGFCFYWKTTYANIETDVGNIHLLEKQKNHSKGMMVGVCIMLLYQ